MNIPFVYHQIYSVPFPVNHCFRMEKFRILYESLLREQIAKASQIITPRPIATSTIQLAHNSQYVKDFFDNNLDESTMKKIGLPWSKELAQRVLFSIGGTILTTQLALEHGIACHLAGGTHHAHYGFGSGFCIFNDLAIAALTLLEQRLADVIFILDCDVHHGDGTATILEKNEQIFTCSIHCKNNFPIQKPQSDLDIPLPSGTEDKEYLEALEIALDAMIRFEPDLVIYDAGVDVHKDDALGKLMLTSEGIAQRDSRVLSVCANNNIPIATVIGGGYDLDVERLAQRHKIVHQQVHKTYGKK